jgi:ABC-type transport system substrate-binding protein
MKRKTFAGLAVTIVLVFATFAQLQGTWSTAPASEDPVIAQSPQGQRGPRIDTLRRKVTRSPASQLVEMTAGPPSGSEVWDGLIRPSDIEEMSRQGKTVSSLSRGGFHYCRIILNYRVHPLDDVNFRHALAHLVPKDRTLATCSSTLW